jgi:PAS domain S-box-containing protein
MTQNLLSSEMLARIIDGSPIPSFVIDIRHLVIHWNTAIEVLSGIKKKDVIGTDQQWRAFYAKKRPTLADLIVDGASEREIQVLYSLKGKRSYLIDGAYEAENFFPDLGSNGRWLHFTASPIKDGEGILTGAIETLEDITERKIAEEALHDSEKSFRTLFESASDAIFVTDLEGNIHTANKAFSFLTGYAVEELVKMNIKSFLSKKSLKLAGDIRNKLLKQQSFIFPYEQILIRKNGIEAICMITTNLISRDGKLNGFQNIARDVTEEKRMHENLQYYLQQITRAQEEERKRVARELHDDTVQVLGSLSRQLDNFIRKKHNFAPDDIQFLKDMESQLNLSARDIHRFSQALRLSVLDDFGLIPALRSLAKSLEDHKGIKTDLTIIGCEKRLLPEVELTIFRIVQEVLNNIEKHARGSEAQVTIEFTPEKIKLTISDNGQGFDLSGRLDDLPRSGKLGLIGIKERARLLGGTLDIKSIRDKGTTLTVDVPI